MSKSLLVIGAGGESQLGDLDLTTGKVGSATVRSALARNIPTVAFLRNPTNLPDDIRPGPTLSVVQGDALSKDSIKQAVLHTGQPVSAVVLAAPMGSMSTRGKTRYEDITRSVVEVVQEVQRAHGKRIKLWVMAGSAILSHPDFPDRLLNSFMPMAFYEEYIYAWKDLEERFRDVDWSINCPALIKSGEPSGPYYYSTDILPGYRKPYSLTRWIPGQWGYALNIMFSNWMAQPVSFRTLGEFMVDHLDLDTELKHKRVGVLEDPGARK